MEQTPAKKNRWRLPLILLTILLAIVPLFYGVVYWFGKDIKQYVVTQINKQIAVEIRVDDIEFSVVAEFPKASLLFSEVTIFENYPGRKKELLRAEQILLSFNVWDILNKNYRISEIVARNGKAYLFTDAKGKTNYNIVKESGGDSTSSAVSLDLQSIRLAGMDVLYEDRELNLFIDGNIISTQLTGNFRDEHFDLAWKGDFYFSNLQYDKTRYIRKRNVTMDAELAINNETDTYTFKKGDVNISGMSFMMKGKMNSTDKGLNMNLNIDGDKMNIRSFLALLPEETQEYVKDYKSEGNFYFNSSIAGLASKNENPSINIKFGIENGQVYKSGLSQGLEKIACRGTFSNGAQHTAKASVLTLESLKAELGGNELSSHCKLGNLDDPYLDLELHGNVDLGELHDLIELPLLDDMKGFALADIEFSGRIKDLKSKSTVLNCRSSGQLKFSNIELKLKDIPHRYTIAQGQFNIQGNDFSVTNFQAGADETSFTLNGTVTNFMPFLFLDHQQIHIDARLNSPFIDLQKVFFTETNKNRMDTSGHIFPDIISMNLSLAIDKLQLYEFKAAQVSGNIILENRVLKSDNLKLTAMNGSAQISGEINNRIKDKVLIACHANLDNIDINQLFFQCANFGQEELTHKHLQGKLDTKIEFASVWSTDFTCDLNKVAAVADIKITNGEINDYEPLNALSKYCDVNDLKHLRFDKLENTIEIRDKTIFIPQMETRNNALDLAISGSHTFENYLDYRVRVKLTDVLRKKRNRPINTEFEEEDTQSGGLYIYLLMKGPIDNLKFSYDKVGVKKKIKESMKQEKQNITDVFKKEFQSEEDRKLREEEKQQEKEINWEDDLPK